MTQVADHPRVPAAPITTTLPGSRTALQLATGALVGFASFSLIAFGSVQWIATPGVLGPALAALGAVLLAAASLSDTLRGAAAVSFALFTLASIFVSITTTAITPILPTPDIAFRVGGSSPAVIALAVFVLATWALAMRRAGRRTS